MKFKRVIYLIVVIAIATSCARFRHYWENDFKESKTAQVSKPTIAATSSVLVIKKPENSIKITKYCKKIDRKFKLYRWEESKCLDFKWLHVRNSVLGDPLMWVVFGDEKENKITRKNTTMVFCGIHGDEITPAKFCFDVMNSLSTKTDDYFSDKIVVVVPIVNPDSFFIKRPTRTNHRGVDINRNFPTKDWKRDALRLWKRRYRKDKRRYPGKRAMSEPETIFHVNIIKRYKPHKIISLHAPLTLLDYDGPDDMKGKSLVGSMASNLLVRMSKQSKNYRVKDYPFFPGSLGNYAGNERGIPTYTLELATSDPSKSKYYWPLFKDAIYSAVEKRFLKFKGDSHLKITKSEVEEDSKEKKTN